MGSSADSESRYVGEDKADEEEPDLEVVPIEGVPTTLVELGLAYWELDYVDDFGVPKWSNSTREIDAVGLGALHYVAAASVRAYVPNEACSRCGDTLAVRTRTDFAAVLAGGSAVCVSCDPQYIEAAAKVRNSFGGAHHQKVLAGKAKQQAEHSWNAQRRELLAECFAVEQLPDEPIPAIRLDLAVALLTILRQGQTSGWTPGVLLPVSRWGYPLTAAPNPQTLINEINGAGLIRIHPQSDVSAFVFKPASFQDALNDAHGVIDEVDPPQYSNRYYPLNTCFYVPYGPSMGTAIQRMDDHLVQRLRLEALSETDRVQLLALVGSTIADEAVRYFDSQIADKSLPPVPEQHRPRLREAALKASEYMSLGRLYVQAWRAAKEAAVAAQKHRLPNSPNMTTFGVNVFERYAGDKTLAEGTPFSEVANLPLAGVTRTLFRTVLDSNPVDLTVDQARAILADIPLPDDGSWSWPAAAEDITKSVEAGTWSGNVLRTELDSMRMQWGRLGALAAQVRVADKLANHYDLYVSQMEPSTAAVATVELAVLTARGGVDDARAAQAVLLWWGDALVQQRASSAPGVVGAPAGEAKADVPSGPSERDGAGLTQTAARPATGRGAQQKPRSNASRKKKRRR